MDTTYSQDTWLLWKRITMYATVLVMIGGLNWLSIGLVQVDLVKLLFRKPMLIRFVYILVGISALLLFFRRDTYLPFLGPTIMPTGALNTVVPYGATQEVVIKTQPGAKVVYWAAEPPTKKTIDTYKEAYGEYKNAGVVIANASGDAALKIRGNPQEYIVPWKGKLSPHIHFRIVGEDGWMGRVQTYWLTDGRIEAFSDVF
jgi:uncharacterized membrane protein YuzA (DUF378 family)